MKTRIISGTVFTVVLALTFFLLPTYITAVTMAALVALASYELLYATGLVRSLRLNVYSAVMAVLLVVWSYFDKGYGPALIAAVLYFVLLFSELLISSGKLPFAQIAYCLVSGILIPFMLSALLRIRVGADGQLLLLLPFIMAYCSDTGAYFIGVLFGKHKMCPNISPKKSWEGFVGGICVAILAMVAYGLVLDLALGRDVNYLLAVTYGLVGALGSVFGDLIMSVVKRQTGIKDYGKLIPGHGGILDRFDSVLITAPLSEALLLILPLV